MAAPAGNYHISPLDVGGAKEGTAEGRHTTMIWLVIVNSFFLSLVLTLSVVATPVGCCCLLQQRSIEAGTLLDPASYFLFRPVATPLSRTTLSGCVLAIRSAPPLVSCKGQPHPLQGLLRSCHSPLQPVLRSGEGASGEVQQRPWSCVSAHVGVGVTC